MPGPTTSVTRHPQPVDVAESLRCAAVDKQVRARRNKQVILRYVIVAAAVAAVVLLIAIAWYYTEGNSVTIKHVSLLATESVARS